MQRTLRSSFVVAAAAAAAAGLCDVLSTAYYSTAANFNAITISTAASNFAFKKNFLAAAYVIPFDIFSVSSSLYLLHFSSIFSIPFSFSDSISARNAFGPCSFALASAPYQVVGPTAPR